MQELGRSQTREHRALGFVVESGGGGGGGKGNRVLRACAACRRRRCTRAWME